MSKPTDSDSPKKLKLSLSSCSKSEEKEPSIEPEVKKTEVPVSGMRLKPLSLKPEKLESTEETAEKTSETAESLTDSVPLSSELTNDSPKKLSLSKPKTAQEKEVESSPEEKNDKTIPSVSSGDPTKKPSLQKPKESAPVEKASPLPPVCETSPAEPPPIPSEQKQKLTNNSESESLTDSPKSTKSKGILFTLFLVGLVFIVLAFAFFFLGKNFISNFLQNDATESYSGDTAPAASTSGSQVINAGGGTITIYKPATSTRERAVDEAPTVQQSDPSSLPSTDVSTVNRVISPKAVENITSSPNTLPSDVSAKPDPKKLDWLESLEVQAIVGSGSSARVLIDGVTYRSGQILAHSKDLSLKTVTSSTLIFVDSRGVLYEISRRGR